MTITHEMLPPTFIRFTSAPESYDYGNTETICVVGKMRNGRDDLRKIRIFTENSLRFQEPRYYSGLHLCVDLAKLEEIHDMIGEIDMEKARLG